MKTASMTAPLGLGRSQNRSSLGKYLPHAVILALLFALLFVASHSSTPSEPVNSSLIHLGQH